MTDQWLNLDEVPKRYPGVLTKRLMRTLTLRQIEEATR